MCSSFFLYDLKLTGITASWKHPHQFQSLNLSFLRSNINLVIEKSVLCSLSCVWLSAAPWTVACKAPLTMEFSRQEYWSGWPLPSPGDFPDPGTEPGSPVLQADSLSSESPGFR